MFSHYSCNYLLFSLPCILLLGSLWKKKSQRRQPAEGWETRHRACFVLREINNTQSREQHIPDRPRHLFCTAATGPQQRARTAPISSYFPSLACCLLATMQGVSVQLKRVTDNAFTSGCPAHSSQRQQF